MNHSQSSALFARARNLLPGGVNSPVRAFKAVGGSWGKGRELPDIVSSKSLKQLEGKDHEQ